jgi:hypothetical protein
VGVSGRNSEDVASVYVAAMEEIRDCQHFVFWADNCAAQNKNWTLYTCLATTVNTDAGPESCTVKYLEKGHTFMSADSFHSRVEKSLKRTPNVYDASDLKQVIANSSHNVTVMPLKFDQFREWDNGVSNAAYTAGKPRLADVQVVRFQKGSTDMYFKTNMDNAEYMSCSFLKRKCALNAANGKLPQSRQRPRGVPAEKLEDIIKKLCPLMPENRRAFWQSYPINNSSLDMIHNYDDAAEDSVS